MADSRQVPTLNLSDYLSGNDTLRQDFVDRLFESIKEFGFVVIANHGINTADFAKAYRLSEQLFALPLAQKQEYETGSGQRGYISFGQEKAAGSEVPDLKEYWHIGPELSKSRKAELAYPENLWPKELPEFESFFIELYGQLLQVAEHLLRALAQGLGYPAEFFSQMVCEGNSVQRLIHYPPLNTLASTQGVRAGAHADINLITLLIGATDSGLELLDRDGQWLAIDNQVGDLVVDTGDMMAAITNGLLPATVHRVVNPEDTSRARYSIPFFVHPRNEVPLIAPGGNPQGAITAGAFLHQRLAENGF